MAIHEFQRKTSNLEHRKIKRRTRRSIHFHRENFREVHVSVEMEAKNLLSRLAGTRFATSATINPSNEEKIGEDEPVEEQAQMLRTKHQQV